MGQLKPSEVRLLVIFGLTVLILGSLFAYEIYAKRKQEVKAELVTLEAEQRSLQAVRTQQQEFNQKRVWLDKHQPLVRDEFHAKEVLDNVVSVRGVEAAGLTFVNSPPEKEPRKEPYYWAFQRRLVVQGSIQNIVQWLAELQSETAFRAITHLHIYPKKRKEAEMLTCEVTVEQRYATEDVILATTPGAAFRPSGAAAPAPPVEENTTPEPPPEKEGTPGNTPTTTKIIKDPAATLQATTPAESNSTATTPSKVAPPATRRVTLPPPAGGGGNAPKVKRPTVRPPTANPPGTGFANPSAGNNGVLANSSRRVGAIQPPPPLQADLDRAQVIAEDTGNPVQSVTPKIAPVGDQIAVEYTDGAQGAGTEVVPGTGGAPRGPNELRPVKASEVIGEPLGPRYTEINAHAQHGAPQTN